jgi:hypothetical protein
VPISYLFSFIIISRRVAWYMLESKGRAKYERFGTWHEKCIGKKFRKDEKRACARNALLVE